LLLTIQGVVLEMCFYIGSGHQSSPPAPNQEGVYIQTFSRRLFTRRLSGYMSNSDWLQEVKDLKAILEAGGKVFDASRYQISFCVCVCHCHKNVCQISIYTVKGARGKVSFDSPNVKYASKVSCFASPEAYLSHLTYKITNTLFIFLSDKYASGEASLDSNHRQILAFFRYQK
jgi:hypothetical protein